MELIVSDISYDNRHIDIDKYISDLKDKAREFSEDINIETANIGHGADWPVYVLSLYIIFLQGTKINDNIDAWISLAKKFSSFLEYVKSKFVAYRLDETAATLVAIKAIIGDYYADIKSIDKLSEEIIPVAPINESNLTNLVDRPYALYLQTYRVNQDCIYIFCIKSKGTIEYSYRVDTDEWMEY